MQLDVQLAENRIVVGRTLGLDLANMLHPLRLETALVLVCGSRHACSGRADTHQKEMDVVLLLLKNGASPNVFNAAGDVHLMRLCLLLRGHSTLLFQLLLPYYLNVCTPTEHKTLVDSLPKDQYWYQKYILTHPFLYAVDRLRSRDPSSRDYQLLESLCSVCTPAVKAVYINAKDEMYSTPLIRLCSFITNCYDPEYLNHVGFVAQLLIRHGADPTICRGAGPRPHESPLTMLQMLRMDRSYNRETAYTLESAFQRVLPPAPGVTAGGAAPATGVCM